MQSSRRIDGWKTLAGGRRGGSASGYVPVAALPLEVELECTSRPLCASRKVRRRHT